MIICRDEMHGDNDKDLTVKQDDKIVAPAKGEGNQHLRQWQ